MKICNELLNKQIPELKKNLKDALRVKDFDLRNFVKASIELIMYENDIYIYMMDNLSKDRLKQIFEILSNSEDIDCLYLKGFFLYQGFGTNVDKNEYYQIYKILVQKSHLPGMITAFNN